MDVRYKTALSCNVATGLTADPADVEIFGIRNIRKCDVEWFSSKGRVCKLLGNGVFAADGTVSLFVQPSLVEESSLFASVAKNFNLVSLTGDRVGPLAFYGQGAGKDPTGFALVQDLLDLAEGSDDAPYVYRPAQVNNDACSFCYYVRSSAVSAELTAVAAETEVLRDATVTVTVPVSVSRMHAIAKTLPEGTFIAAFKD